MKKEIKISGMHCNHCKARVEQALTDISGINSVKVDLKKACAIVETKEEIKDEILKNTVEELGFGVESISIKKGFFGK